MTAAAQTPTVIEALAAVMGDVQGVRKGDRNTQQNYMFRGIDAVVNAVGPALRAHNVVVVPVAVEHSSEQYTTSKGTLMRGVTLNVTFRFYGPAGDSIDAQACGEASDSGDKATPKAHSVAYRTLLLQALCIPTDEPDPDSESHERGVPTSKSESQFKPPADVSGDATPITEAQKKKLGATINDLVSAGAITAQQVAHVCGVELAEDAQVDALAPIYGRLTKAQAAQLIGRLERYRDNLAKAEA